MQVSQHSSVLLSFLHSTFHAVIYFPPPPPHNYDVVLRILALNICALNPNRRPSSGSYLNLGRNAIEKTKTLSLTEHIAYKSTLKPIHRRYTILQVEVEQLFQDSISFHMIQEWFLQGIFSQITVLVNIPSNTSVSRRQAQKSSIFYFQAWEVKTKGNSTFWKPCHVLWRSKTRKAVYYNFQSSILVHFC